ncbi:MAG: hypothetical protein ACRCST_17775 [Turicibacter sp.]
MQIMIVKIILVLCIIGVIGAGILYFLSYNSYTKDVDRRIEEAEKKDKQKKRN